jgi:hypothetical protein
VLIREVFVHGYLSAMRPTLAISIRLLLAGAAACLLLRRAAAQAAPAAVRDAAAASEASAVNVAASPAQAG